jgi:hypothetical protein
MTTAISAAPPLQSHFFLCNCINDLCKAVYEIAMKFLKMISDCFFSSSSAATSLVSRVEVTVTNPILSFYQGLEANNNGVTLDQILNWDDGRLEAVHNYIQWLFPLTTPSGPNPTAPILDQATIQTFRNSPVFKAQMLRSFRRMLSFYGLQMNETARVISRAPNFNARAAVWLTANNHNFLRITRMLHSLQLLGLPEYGTAFFHIMHDIYSNEGQGIIDRNTLGFWLRANGTPDP